MRATGYGSYRGRATFKTFLKILAVIVVVLAVLCGAAYIYLQQYLVVSEEGVRLELPFFQREDEPEQTSPTPTPTPDRNLVVVTPEPTPEPVSEALLPVLLPHEALYDGTAQTRIGDGGGDCALFDMKADNGALGYISALEQAQAAGVSSDDASINVAIRALNGEDGLYTVARVSCFKDHATGTSYDLAILTNSGYRWIDPEGVRWTSPANAGVRAYLTGVCAELAALGFDEILLDWAGYPSEGSLHYIRKGAAYDETQFAAVIDGFYAQVEAALAEYGVKLSVVTTREAIDGLDTLTGQTPGNLARFDRLWIRDETGALIPLSAAGETPETP